MVEVADFIYFLMIKSKINYASLCHRIAMVFLGILLFSLRMCPTKYFQIFFGEEYLFPWANKIEKE